MAWSSWKVSDFSGVFIWDSHFQIHDKFPLISGVDSHQHTELFYSILLPEWDPSARYATHERHRCMGFLSFCEGNGTFAPKKSSFIPKNPQGTGSSQSEIAWSQWNRVITMIGSFTDESMSEGLSPNHTLRLEPIHDVVRGKSFSEIERNLGQSQAEAPNLKWLWRPKFRIQYQSGTTGFVTYVYNIILSSIMGINHFETFYRLYTGSMTLSSTQMLHMRP